MTDPSSTCRIDSSLADMSHIRSPNWRLEDGCDVHDDGIEDSGIIAIENPEECVLWYFNYFLGKKHTNYLGIEENGDVFGMSTLREPTEQGDYSYKIIVWTSSGIERQMFQAKQRTSFTASELVKRAAPHMVIKKIKEIEANSILQDFKELESTQTELSYKFGVLLAKPGQTNEDQFYDNLQGSEHYQEFLKLLGDTVELNTFKGFRGGLDVVNNTTGTQSLFTSYMDYQIMFHVSTMLPFMPNASQQIERKRHIGNDIVIVIFYDAESDDNVISWDPSLVNSKFNHIFAMVKPSGDGYKVEFVIKNTIAKFGPKVPFPSYFQKGESFRQFLLAKLVNGQRAALQSSSFSTKLLRTFKGQLQNIYDKYNQSTIPRRRSASGNHVMIGKELKEKDFVKHPLTSSLKNLLSRSVIFETEIIAGSTFNENINCLDVIESDEPNCILIFATNEGIYISKTDLHNSSNESSSTQTTTIFQKVMNLKEVSRLTYIRKLNVLLAMTPKGIHVYDMVVVMTYYRHKVAQRLSMSSTPDRATSSSSDEPVAKKLDMSKGCTEYAKHVVDDEDGITLLYVVVKKTIYQYEWCTKKHQFVKNKEICVNDTIKTMCNVAPGMVCVGVSSQFLLVDMFTSTVKELVKKQDSEPVKALSLDTEILLCFNNIGFFVDERAIRTRNYELKWGSIPSSLLLLPNYIIGISGQLIEVRTLLNGNIIQSIPTLLLTSSLSNSSNSILPPSSSSSNHNNNNPLGNCLHGSGGIEKEKDSQNLNGASPNPTVSSSNSNSSSPSSSSLSLSIPNSSFTFNDMAHNGNGHIYVACSSKGTSCIIRIKPVAQPANCALSPPGSPAGANQLVPAKGILSLSTIDRL